MPHTPKTNTASLTSIEPSVEVKHINNDPTQDAVPHEKTDLPDGVLIASPGLETKSTEAEVNLKLLFQITNVGTEQGLQAFTAAVEKAEAQKRQKGGLPLEYTPLVKSKYTFDLELLFKHILSGSEVEFSLSEDSLEYIATMHKDSRTYVFNLSELLKYANLNHIAISESDDLHYEAYAKTMSAKPGKMGERGFPEQK